MRSLGSLAVLLFLTSVFYAPLSLAKVTVKARISSLNLEIGDQLSVSIEISSDKELARTGPKFKPPMLSGFDFLGSSTSVSFGLGGGGKKLSYTTTYNLNYSCNKAGEYKFPSMNLDISSVAPTKPMGFKVYKKLPENLKKQKQANRRRRGLSNPFDRLDQIDRFFDRNTKPREVINQELEFFTEVEVSKTEIFKGEQILAEWYIYVTDSASLGTFDTLRFPTLRGFWKEDVNFASRFFWKPYQKDGKRYQRALLSSYALTPYKEGDYEIDPFELRTVVSQGFFNPVRKVLKAKSDPVAILVKPLPEPQPKDFLGGVGRFKFELNQTNQKQEVLYGERFDVNFRIVGDQSATKFLKEPSLDLGGSFRLYKSKEDYKFIPSRVSSYKLFNYSLIPKEEGVFKFPDVKVSFLDPDTGAYYEQYIKLPTYKVLPNKNLKKIKDEDYAEQDEIVVGSGGFKFQELNQGFLLGFLYRPLPVLFLILIFLLAFGASIYIYKTVSRVPTFQEDLIKKLEQRLFLVSDLLKEKKRNKALTELINILSLLIGSVSGKRFGAEQELEKAIENLPTSLKSSAEELKTLNEDLQNMRFSSSLESYTNKVKLEECLTKFKKIFLNYRKYLR
jgi:hypothetical protein